MTDCNASAGGSYLTLVRWVALGELRGGRYEQMLILSDGGEKMVQVLLWSGESVEAALSGSPPSNLACYPLNPT